MIFLTYTTLNLLVFDRFFKRFLKWILEKKFWNVSQILFHIFILIFKLKNIFK